jgi:hypothetical protein
MTLISNAIAGRRKNGNIIALCGQDTATLREDGKIQMLKVVVDH